jgi:hypothetical protein
MFTFLRPVWRLATLAGVCLALWIGAEILTVRQTAEAVNQIKLVRAVGEGSTPGFSEWLESDAGGAGSVVRAILALTH